MSVRRTVAGTVSGAVVASALLVFAAPSAHAADPDDTTFTPVAADLIGAGSDTSQHAVFTLAQQWNAKTPAPSYRIATFAATGGGQITLPSGAINRPNGSGAGKNLLFGATNNADVDFARSSSSLSTAEVSAGLQQIPFAVDELAMAVSSTVPSNAPANLTPAQIVAIYKGEITNWSQIDATKSGIIAPKIPQGGSGTRSFFVGQLKAMNEGVDVALAGTVAEVQEHDDTAVKSNPNAIAPFSVGRAGLLGDTLRILGGWDAQRGLYNVVRGPELTDPKIQAVFGADGFFCSDEARPLIRDAGFAQLDSEDEGGVCGVQTQSPTTNFQVNAPNADDSDFTPVAADLIGAGSDTSQHAVWSLAELWNAKTPAPSYRIATFAATGGGQITLPSGAINRPNGSGAGKNLLFGATNNADVDFARSSSSLSTAEVSAGLQQIPFAVDELAMAVSSTVPSNAPANLTPAQIVAIYKGEITNWSQIDATKSGIIAPKIPQGGSGTRSFFVGQLKAMNEGVDVALAGTVAEVQEHDDTAVKSNPNAIAPFSVGRAGLLGDTLRILGGWDAQRGLYNVVRGPELTDPKIQAVFGTDGLFCSDDARELIEAAGFGQLDSEDEGGVCGVQTQSPTTNFQVNGGDVVDEPTATSLVATATAPAARRVVLRGVVSPSAAGTVTFRDRGAVVAANVPVNGGVATHTLNGVTPGAHSYTAQFTPADAEAYAASADTTPFALTVRTTAVVKETYKAKVKKGKRATGTVTVSLAGAPAAAATGKVTLKVGTKVVGTGKLVNGKVTITLKKLKKGKNKVVATWAGNALAPGAKLTFTINQK